MNVRTMMIALCVMVGVAAQAQEPKVETLHVARQLYASGKLVAAEKSFGDITREYPDNITAQMYLGQTLFKEEKYAQAITPYEKVRDLESSGAKLTLTQRRILGDQLAMSYGLSGRVSAAKELLQEAVRKDPGYPLNYYNLACLNADENDRLAAFKNLALAFEHRDQVLPGEQMPNPASDPSFLKYAKNADFKALVSHLEK